MSRRPSLPSLLAALALVGCGSEDTQTRCSATEACGTGLVCQDELCVTLPCDGPAACPTGTTCTVSGGEGVCTAIECGCETCDACPAGETCSAGLCVAAGAACSAAAPCAGTDVCEDGACRPCAGAECDAGCTTASCPDGQQCNATTGACEAAGLGVCAACTDNAACGADARCIQLQGGKSCLPNCTASTDCAAGWTCQTGAAGGNCVPPTYSCAGCFAEGCPDGQTCDATGACVAEATCDPTCSGATPVCDAGTCVGCLTNADCGAGRTCNVAAKVCEGASTCTGATPYQVGDRCVECVTNSHCGERFCDQATNTCSDDKCASCADPYPACIDYEGQTYCVQCATNADCEALRGAGSTCNTSTYACEGGVVGPAARCQTNADCGSSSAGFNLQCDVATGFCYDAAGNCDDVTSFCPGTDGQVRPCQSLLALLGGGGSAPALPPEFSGGGTLPGLCSCSGANPLGIPPLPGTCRVGTCVDPSTLLGGTPGNTVCVDIGSLLGP
jgi:Cys-rich repeat protein